MAEEKKDNQRLSGSIALTRLIHVRMKKKGKNGEVEGLFIPIDANKLEEVTFETKDGKVTEIQIPITVIVKPETDEKGQDGFLAKNISTKLYKESTPEQREEFKSIQPILGNLKDWKRGGGEASAPPTGDAGDGKTFEDDDDLPF